MSLKATGNVWTHSEQSGTKLLLMLAIADHANDDGYAWPGIISLANKVRRSPRQVMRLVKQLVEAGELLSMRIGRSNHYIIDLRSPTAIPNHCFRCRVLGIDHPHSKFRRRMYPYSMIPNREPGKLDWENTVLLCKDCMKLIRNLSEEQGHMGIEAIHKSGNDPLTTKGLPVFARFMANGSCKLEIRDTSVTCPIGDARVTIPDEQVTSVSEIGDTGVTLTVSNHQVEEPVKDSVATAPQMTEEEAEEFIGHSRIPDDVEERDLDTLTHAERAAIASPVSQEEPETPGEDDWIKALRKAPAKGFHYHCDMTMDDVIAVVARFRENSGIEPPTHGPQARAWHAGAVTLLYNFHGQLSNTSVSNAYGSKAGMMKQAFWCVDFFFQDDCPLSFITATSPHSMISSVPALVAELRKLREHYSLTSRLPGPEQVAEYYTQKGEHSNGTTRRAPGERDKEAMVRILRGEEHAAQAAA